MLLAQRKYFLLYREKTGIDLLQPDGRPYEEKNRPRPLIAISKDDPFNTRALQALLSTQSDPELEAIRRQVVRRWLIPISLLVLGPVIIVTTSYLMGSNT